MGIFWSRPIVIVDPYPTVIVESIGPNIIVYNNSYGTDDVYFGGAVKNLDKLNLKQLKIIADKFKIKYNKSLKKSDILIIIKKKIKNNKNK
jgi:hypothetical protein